MRSLVMLGRKVIVGNLVGPVWAVVRSGSDRPHGRLRPLAYTLIDAEGFRRFTKILGVQLLQRHIESHIHAELGVFPL